MNQVLVDLKNLQEADDGLKSLREAATLAAAKKNEAETRLKGFESALGKLADELVEMRRRHRELEAEVRDFSLKFENNQKRQGAAKNTNEFNALAKEADFLKGRINSLEDEILELLDRIDKAEIEKAELSLVVTEEAASCAKTGAEVEELLKTGDETQRTLEAKRASLVQALPPDSLRQYEEIAKIRAGRAVAAAALGLCQACGLAFPPQLFNELQRNESIKTCPNCGRVLYWRDHPDFQPAG